MVSTRSSVTPSGMTATKRSPICAAASARAMLVEPLEASTTASPAHSVP
jgi:hypothetical protein